LIEDPVLAGLSVFRFQNTTNFSVSRKQADRLNALWTKTGNDWTYEEAVAGLWAYDQTFGHEVSRLSGSAVSRVALLTGRAVSGVYNKVMNFRYIDPRDDRAGMSGASAMDHRVWAEFYDPVTTSLRSGALEAEFERLWANAPEDRPPDEARATDLNFEQETRRLAQRSLEELIALYAAAQGNRNQNRRPDPREWGRMIGTRSSPLSVRSGPTSTAKHQIVRTRYF
jgi:hypothetical protein